MEAILGYGSTDDEEQPADHPAIAAADADGAAAAPLPPAHGRVRRFPHVEGNYSIHVFIPVELPPTCRPPLAALLRHVALRLPGLQPVVDAPAKAGGATPAAGEVEGLPGMVQASYHLSLSRSAAARRPQLESLSGALRHQLRRLRPFVLAMGRPEVFLNDDRSRTFLALAAAATPAAPGGPGPGGGGGDPLQRAIDAASAAFLRHGLPRFYDDPRPHVSVAWVAGDCEAALQAALAEPEGRRAGAAVQQCGWRAAPKAIVYRSGQRQHAVWPPLS
jgi:hypothetical protein